MQQILDPFDASRSRPWPHVVQFIEETPRAGWLLDLAAGNGRHALAAARVGHPVLAVDVAHALVVRLRGRLQAEGALPSRAGCVEADALTLPFSDASIAKAVFAAGLHCVRGRGNRLAALAELHRVLVAGAPVMVTVWWRDPKRFRGPLAKSEARIDAAHEAAAPGDDPGRGGEPDPPGRMDAGRTVGSGAKPGDRPGAVPPWEPGDVVLPWSHGVTRPVDRYFHLYREDELRRDLEATGFSSVEVRRVRVGSTWNLVATLRRSTG